MKIFVCIKQVPDTETKMKLLADGSNVDLTGAKLVVNPYDEFAIEEAVKLQAANPGSQTFVVTLGPKQKAQEALRTALAMGIDEAIVIHAEQALDSFATAKALSALIQQEGGADLILTGKLAIDDNASSVPQMIAAFMKIPHCTVVSKLTFAGSTFTAERDIEGGSKEVVELSMPCVVAANKGLNTPRYASLPGIMKAKKKAIKEVDLAALGVTDADIKTKISKVFLPAEKPAVKMIAGEPQEQATTLVKLLRDEAKAL